MDATTTMPSGTTFAFPRVATRGRVPAQTLPRLAVIGLVLVGLAGLVVALGLEHAAIPGAVAQQFALSGERLHEWASVMARGLSDPFAFSYPLPAGFGR